jgi:hypothetical protein
VAFGGIAPVYVTFKIDNSTITYTATAVGGAATTMINMAVMFSTDETVALANDGAAVIGKLVSVESDNYCTVQTGGYCTLPGGDSATLTVGSSIVGALGASSARGYIRSAASGTAAELIKARGFIVNNDTTTAVVVNLD